MKELGKEKLEGRAPKAPPPSAKEKFLFFNFALNFFIYRFKKKRWRQGMILLDDSHSGNWTVNNLYYSIKMLIAKRNKLYKYNNDHLIRFLWCLYF